MRKPIGIVHTLQLIKLLKGVEPEGETEAEPRIEELDLAAPLFVIRGNHNPTDVVGWIRDKGYRAVVAAAPGVYSSGMGVVFGRKNGPLLMANVGDELFWDGENITVRWKE